ncbi:hypothetical protein CLPU_3c02810 [Gottschalkia purinilytica]|uniref:Uncharacterized protein n=1 Tax=Gottschalkia purinilytica TaxID=1503 RepID=A0A0L0WDI8_GOTPU|nr:hypothetical protein [Gottschalkia purinilytica]KNF09501.1 hypothetical protein CLPU_3c02810 [Gottschalkia purinilytica]
MLNSIKETRIREDNGLHRITLEVPEKDFFEAYDEVDEHSAYDLLKQYLLYREDDGRPKNVDINYNKNSHIVTITTELHYLGNDHTDYN